METKTIPETIETKDFGTCIIRHCDSAPVSTYRCPLCWYAIDLGETHKIIIPPNHDQQRKHVHTDCLRSYIEFKLDIVLFPTQFKKAEGHAGWKR